MLLAVDIGNSDVVIGAWDKQQWKQIWRVRSLPEENALYYQTRLRNYFLEAGFRFSDFNQIIVCSVVPALTGLFRELLQTLFGFKPIVVNVDSFPSLQVKIDRPHELGSDLFANAVAAYTKYQQNCIIVDFGTALTFTTVSAKRELLGVAIAPGLKTAMKALSANTAQLPEIPLFLPPSALGKNTAHAIQAGILLGYVGLVEALLNQIRKELNGECVVVATGGLSSIIQPLHSHFTEVNINLTLDGLRIIGESIL